MGTMETPPPQRAPQTGAGFVRLGLLFYGVMAAVAVVWRLQFQDGPLWGPGGSWAPPPGLPAWLRDAGLGLAAGGGLLAVSEAMTRWTAWGERLARAMAATLGPLQTPDALLLASASGLAEELFFRGALQPVAGLWVASLLFGAVHFVPRRDFWPWTLFAVLAGLLFGALYHWTGSLTAPVLAHVLVNGVNLPRLVRRYGPGAVSPPGR